MKSVFGMALVLACLAAATPQVVAQTQPANDSPASGAGTDQNPSSAPQSSRPQTQIQQNPFPEDTSSIPVMPSRDNAGSLTGTSERNGTGLPMPPDDVDPVRSPEDAALAEQSSEHSSSSSLNGLGNLLPPPDDESQPGKSSRKGQSAEAEHQETAAEDESVGKYYLDNKDWKAALSRFQSALVLDPDNPDVRVIRLSECEERLNP